MSATVCQLNDFLKGLKPEYNKTIASLGKRIVFLLDERNFLPDLSVKIDVDQVTAILKILISNAIKHTEKGYVKVGYHLLDGDLLQFFIEDTGIGFDPIVLEEMNKYLETDGQSTDEIPDNIAGAKRMTLALGGKIIIESQQGMGSTVRFSTKYEQMQTADPEVKQTETQPSQEKQTVQDKSGNTQNGIWKGKTILIAEDELVNYMFLEVLFEDTGAKLIHALDGQKAIDAVKANPEINLVLMDIKMPNVNGLDATRQIKSMRPQLPVIAQTAYAMQDDEYKALQAGCNDYISKPIDANKLISLMKKYLW